MKTQHLFHSVIFSLLIVLSAVPVKAQARNNECPAHEDIAGRIIRNTAMGAASGLACIYFLPMSSVACSALAGAVITTYEILQENCDEDEVTGTKDKLKKTGKWEGISEASDYYDDSKWHGDEDMIFSPDGNIYERYEDY